MKWDKRIVFLSRFVFLEKLAIFAATKSTINK